MKVAVLGCGSIGRRHLLNLFTLGIDDLIPFDPDPAVRARISRECPVRCRADLDEVWAARPDAALVAAPPDVHTALGLAAAHHGCHLFVEKPLSDSLANLAELEAALAARQLVSMVGCNMRFHPGPAAIKRLLEEGAIGRVLSARLHTGSYLPAWRPWMDYRSSYSADGSRGGGALLDCIHEIDLALWYFGHGRLAAAAVRPAESLALAVDGLAELLVDHDGGALSSIHLDFVARDYCRTCQVIGERGTLYWDIRKPVVRIADEAGERRIDLPGEAAIDRMYVDELRHFLDSVERAEPSMCPLAEGRKALEIALAARSFAGQPLAAPTGA